MRPKEIILIFNALIFVRNMPALGGIMRNQDSQRHKTDGCNSPAFLIVLFAALLTLGTGFVGFARPAAGAAISECPVFLANNIWNVPVDRLPVAANSSAYINCIGADAGLHPDFGSGEWEGGPIGIPYTTVPGTQIKVPIHFVEYGDESDPGPYPIPSDAAREWGSDHHVLVVDTGACKLYELYHAEYQADGSWNAGSGAVFDLRSNALRTLGWTSADEGGLPMFPGLVRYDEVASGAISHALRFTVPQSYRGYVWPARHLGQDDDQYCPPMGQRFRLRADFDISGFSSEVQVILRALKKYGMIVADDGGAWYISGAPDSRWNNDTLHRLEEVLGSNFEAVDVSSLMVDPDSGEARTTPPKTINSSWLPLLLGN